MELVATIGDFKKEVEGKEGISSNISKIKKLMDDKLEAQFALERFRIKKYSKCVDNKIYRMARRIRKRLLELLWVWEQLDWAMMSIDIDFRRVKSLRSSSEAYKSFIDSDWEKLVALAKEYIEKCETQYKDDRLDGVIRKYSIRKTL